MSRLFISLAVAASVLAVAPAAAQQIDLRSKITVTGEGESRVSPDMAVLTLSVLREAETAREAMDENNSAMAAVIAALKEEGIEARDLQTSGLSISPQYSHPTPRSSGNGQQKPRIVGYQVNNTLTVRVRDLDIVGQVLDRSVSLGVNQGGHIYFTNDDPSEALTEARRRAVENAMAKARTLTEAAGVSLGDILELSEHSAMPPPMPMMRAYGMEMQVAQDSAVPVEAGENTYKVHVNVTFEIEQN